MQAVNLKEARRRLGELVTAAQHGQAVSITRRGKAAAWLIPVPRSRGNSFPDLSAFRRRIRTKGASLSETVVALRREGRY